MPRRHATIAVPAALRPLLERPADWPAGRTWRIVAAACRASGVAAWAARVEGPAREPVWLQGRSPSRPGVIQSECVDALIAGLETTPPGATVEVVAPTSLRYLVEGAQFPAGSPEYRLARLAGERRIWARYALGGELEPLVAECLARASVSLAPLRWPGEAALGDSYVLYTDGGCSREACAAAWVLRRAGLQLRQHAWCLPGPLERDAVRLAEFQAAAEGLAAVPPGASIAVVTDHADVSDFGVRGVTAFRASPRVASVLRHLWERAAARQVRWYWAARGETDGQRRCQTLIDRQLRAATALTRFLTTCQAAGLRRVYLPSFAAWLAPREPLVGQTDEQWAATFECRDRYLRADPSGPRLYVRQVRLRRGPGTTLRDAFAASRAATWCAQLAEHPPLAGAAACVLGELRSHLLLLALLFEPDTALLLQTRPGATLEDLQAAAHHVQLVDLSGGGGGR